MCEVSCSVQLQLAQGGLQEYAFGSFTSTPAVYTKKCIQKSVYKKVYTVNQEIFIHVFLVLVIFMVFNFSFLYWNLM